MGTINWQSRHGGVHRARIGWVEIEVAWRGSRGGYNVHCEAPLVIGPLKSTDLEEAKSEALDKVLRGLRAAVKAMEGGTT